MRIINLVNGINGAITGSTGQLVIPVGRRYHNLKVFLSATDGVGATTDPLRIVSAARLTVNGVLMRNLTTAQILKIASLNGFPATAATGELPFYFSEPWRASVVGEESTSWDMGDGKIRTFLLELDFLAGLVAGPSVVVEASFDYGRNVDQGGKPFLAIIKQLPTVKANAVGVLDLQDLPQQFPIQRIHLQASAGTISSAEVWNDSTKVMEGLTANLNDFYRDYRFVTAGAFSLSLIFDHTQQISDALSVLNNNLNVRPTFSAGGACTALTEFRANGFV